MISRQHRFHGERSINYIYKKGRVARSGPISVKFVLSKNDYRLAVVVSRKVSKLAVARNRIRRRLYEQFRLIHKTSNRPIFFDMVLSVYDDEIAKMPSEKLNHVCQKLLQKIEETS